MVSEALQERANLVEIAPHLAYALPIMLPVYAYWQIPYFWVGIKVLRLQVLRSFSKFHVGHGPDIRSLNAPFSFRRTIWWRDDNYSNPPISSAKQNRLKNFPC